MTTTRVTLLQRLRDRSDASAWEEFHELYAPLLEGYARAFGLSPADAQEVRDQCLEVLVRRLPSFEYQRARGRFKAWLHGIARGKVIDGLRAARLRAGEESELERLVDESPRPDELWARQWRAEHLRYALGEALEGEPEPVRQAFEQLLLEELDVPGVCARTGLNANRVYKARARILGRIRRTLERLRVDED
jgi:RNA polymerase sigma factor (sigma-70 family)